MKRVLFVVILAALLIAACGGDATPESDTFDSPLGMPNPASKFCEDQGYTLQMREEAGGTVGYCIFPDGNECEEWAFFNGECGDEYRK
jgi:putative hemolysin